MADILFRRVSGTAPFAKMAAPKFGLTYVERAGFNAWAEANNIVVLCACHACFAVRRLVSALRAELRARRPADRSPAWWLHANASPEGLLLGRLRPERAGLRDAGRYPDRHRAGHAAPARLPVALCQ